MSEFDKLFASFRDVSREFSVRPFWFWNGVLTPAEVQRQIEVMDAQGIHGAHVHNRSGLRPRYLSEAWWELVRAALEKSKELDFAFCMIDDYNWPSGEARDYSQAGFPSRVLATNPDFRMRSLAPETRSVPGGQPIQIGSLTALDHVIAGQRSVSGELDSSTLREVTADVRTTNGVWHAPAGHWELFIFRLQYTVGVDGGQVDLMNRDAVRTFLDVIYEEYRSHVGYDFGKAFRAFYMDHEGDYGWRLAWTPRLFETFKTLKGYDLVPLLPLLLEEGGTRTPTVRCDYFDVVGTLYADSFFQQITDWCTQYGLEVSGHVWEESLQAQTAFQGDHFRIQRALGLPGMDTLFEWGRYPRHFKEVSSVAHFRDLPFTVENQGVQGVDNYLSLSKIKRTSNMLGVWGTTRFIPHALNGNPDRIDFPEDWFERQPWWRFFHHYADYAARISAMNTGGRHVCDVLLYYPIETAWAHGDVCFSDQKWNMGFEGIDTQRGQILNWHNVVDELNKTYGEIIDTLPAHLWDLDISDDYYLQEASISDSRIHIANEAFRVLILPPMTTIRRSAAKRAREFFEAGGTVIAVNRLPFDSMESGRADPELRREWEMIFGTTIVEHALKGKLQHGAFEYHGTSDTAGRAAWVAGVEAVLTFLEGNVERDVRVIRGDADHFFALHRIKEGCHLYWFVNDSDSNCDIVVDVPVSGRPQLWDPDGGESRSLYYTRRASRTELHLQFAPWQGFYVVFAPEAVDQPIAVTSTNLTAVQLRKSDAVGVILKGQLPASEQAAWAQVEIEGRTLVGKTEIAALETLLVGGSWECTPQRASAAVCYARMRTAATGHGVALGWHLPRYNDAFWESEWLSSERFAIQDWWLIGMFDYHNALGFNEIMPPEREINLDAEYLGRNGQPIHWQRYSSPGRIIDLDSAFHTENERSFANRWVTAFALSHVYSPDDRTVEVRSVADCNAKVWLNGELLISERDDHQGYLEMRDAFGISVTAHLRKGWNPLLLKVSQGIRQGSNFDFVIRLCDAEGQHLPDLRYAASPEDLAAETGAAPPAFERWYRIDVPPGATAVELPMLGDSLQSYIDGTPINGAPNGEVKLPAGAQLLAICAPFSVHLPDFLTFRTGSISSPLQSWTHTGLSYYTGEFTYIKQFDLPDAYLNYRLVLDLGAVGTTAEVWLNGIFIGERVWQPFAFDITTAAHSGANELKIVVANTAANQRAGGHTERQLWGVVVRGPELLDQIEENGLLGPVSVVPWVEVELLCI